MEVSTEMLVEAEMFLERVTEYSQEAVNYRSECIRFGCGMGYD